jgi:hypothetical protein
MGFYRCGDLPSDTSTPGDKSADKPTTRSDAREQEERREVIAEYIIRLRESIKILRERLD